MNKKGFTLIELLIVVAIIGIVAAIAIPNLLVAMQKGKQKATMGDMKSVGNAIESYITDWSFAPQANNVTLGAGLDFGWFRPFYIKVLPLRDGWGTAFMYYAGVVGNADQDIYSTESWGRDKLIATAVAAGEYPVVTMADFNNNIIYSNGQFTLGPQVKR